MSEQFTIHRLLLWNTIAGSCDREFYLWIWVAETCLGTWRTRIWACLWGCFWMALNMWIGRRSERLLFLLWIFAKSGEKEKTVLIYNKVTNKYLSFKIFVLNILYLIRKFKPWVYRKKEGSCLVRTRNTWHWAGGQFLFCLHTGIWALPGCWACCLLLPAVAFLVARPEDFSWSKTIHWLPGVSSLLLRILVLLSHPCTKSLCQPTSASPCLFPTCVHLHRLFFFLMMYAFH